MGFKEEDFAAIAKFDTSQNVYLTVVGKGNDQHLEAVERNFLGRLWMKLGISDSSIDKVAAYVNGLQFDEDGVQALRNKTQESKFGQKFSQFEEKFGKHAGNIAGTPAAGLANKAVERMKLLRDAELCSQTVESTETEIARLEKLELGLKNSQNPSDISALEIVQEELVKFREELRFAQLGMQKAAISDVSTQVFTEMNKPPTTSQPTVVTPDSGLPERTDFPKVEVQKSDFHVEERQPQGTTTTTVELGSLPETVAVAKPFQEPSSQELEEIEKKYTQEKPYTWDSLQQKGIMHLHGIDPMIPDAYLDRKVDNLPNIDNFTNLQCLSIDPHSSTPVEDVAQNFNEIYRAAIQESGRPIILPVNDHMHFSTFVLSADRKSLYHFDPLRNESGRKNNDVLNKIIEELKTTTGVDTLTVRYNPKCQQTDGWSCGHWTYNFISQVTGGRSEEEAAESALVPEDFERTVNEYVDYCTKNENNIPTGMEEYSRSLEKTPIDGLAKEVEQCLSSLKNPREREKKVDREFARYNSPLDLQKLQYGDLDSVNEEVDTKEEFAEKLRHLGTFWSERGQEIWNQLDEGQQQFAIKFLQEVTKTDSSDVKALFTKYCETLPKKREQEYDDELMEYNAGSETIVEPNIDDYFDQEGLVDSLKTYISTATQAKTEREEVKSLLNTLPNKLFLCLSVANQRPHGMRDLLISLKQAGAIQPKSPAAIELEQIFADNSFGKGRMIAFFLELYGKVNNSTLRG